RVAHADDPRSRPPLAAERDLRATRRPASARGDFGQPGFWQTRLLAYDEPGAPADQGPKVGSPAGSSGAPQKYRRTLAAWSPLGERWGWSMRTRCERPWPAIDLAELRYCLAFGSSVEEMADFLHRDVEDVRHQIAVEAQRAASRRPH